MEPVPCQSLGNEVATAISGFAPETAASYLFRITPHGFPSFAEGAGRDGPLIFKKDASCKAVVSLIAR